MTLTKLLWRWCWYGYIAGFLSGLGDTLWSWGSLAQFLPSGGGRIAAAFYQAGLYALTGAIVATLGALAAYSLRRWTRIEEMARRVARSQDVSSSRQSSDSLALLSHVLAWTGLGLPAVFAAYQLGLHTIVNRNHKGLVVVVIIAATLGFLLLAGCLGLFVARFLEGVLIRVLPRRSLGFFSRLPVVLVLGLGLVALATVILAVDQWELVAQLRPRPVFVGLGYTCLLICVSLLGKVVAARIPIAHRLVFAFLATAALAVAILLVLLIGKSDSVRKGSTAHTGLGGLLSETVRRMSDVDGDGFSSLLGGGDCAPLDSTVHPGALDIPGDGLDQNCAGQDTSVYRSVEDAQFMQLPDGLPSDANILFISIDAVRADHVSAYGYGRKTTPTIDSVAAKGVLFENAWAHAPSTRYSIPAIITGRHPSQVLWNMSMWWPGLKRGNETIAEMLKGRGFTTGALLAYHYFHPKRLINQGFDVYDNSLARLHRGRDPASTSGSSAAELAAAAVRFIERHRDKRFYLWVHFYDPHYRYEKHPGTPEFGEKPEDLYDHEILFTDSQIGRIFKSLEEFRLSKNTIIVITADHGTGFGEHGIKHHGYHLYGAQTRVPLIIYVPGMKPRRVKSPAAHVDILPTLANLVGAQPTSTMFGRSLLRTMTGRAPAAEDRVVYQEVIYEGPTERWAAITKRWHLIYNRVPDNTFELYDVQHDKSETRDLWGEVDVSSLKNALLSWIAAGKFAPETYADLASAVHRKKPNPRLVFAADFDGKVRLEGVDIGAKEVRAGGQIELVWYYKSLKKMSGDWRVFVHIRGTKKFFVGDHRPVDGALPFEAWRPGEWVADRQIIDVPSDAPAGHYEITMGLYRGRKRMNVSVEPGRAVAKNAVRVATIRVIP